MSAAKLIGVMIRGERGDSVTELIDAAIPVCLIKFQKAPVCALVHSSVTLQEHNGIRLIPSKVIPYLTWVLVGWEQLGNDVKEVYT
jgi:hypothetical protein